MCNRYRKHTLLPKPCNTIHEIFFGMKLQHSIVPKQFGYIEVCRFQVSSTSKVDLVLFHRCMAQRLVCSGVSYSNQFIREWFSNKAGACWLGFPLALWVLFLISWLKFGCSHFWWKVILLWFSIKTEHHQWKSCCPTWSFFQTHFSLILIAWFRSAHELAGSTWYWSGPSTVFAMDT